MDYKIMTPKQVSGAIRNMRLILNDYVVDHGLKSLVIGVSGGADSALECALAEPVCESLGIPLIGRSLPSASNKPDEVERAKLVGAAFCDEFAEESIEDDFKCLDASIMKGWAMPSEAWAEYSEHRDRVRRGNIKARVRMIRLRDLAYRRQGIVLGTDNLTEYLLGFWTLDGDVGDLGLIQNMWKTEVYLAMSVLRGGDLLPDQQRALQACEEANPTDGLGVSNSDLDQLGAKSYGAVDQTLLDWLRAKEKNLWGKMEELRGNPVVQRHERSHFKRNNPCNVTREDLLA